MVTWQLTIDSNDPARMARFWAPLLGYVPEQLDWGYGWMRVGRLLAHHARYFPHWDAGYAAHLTRVFDLRLDQRMKTLSKGQGRRVHLVLALAHRPPLAHPRLEVQRRDPVLGLGLPPARPGLAHQARCDTPVWRRHRRPLALRQRPAARGGRFVSWPQSRRGTVLSQAEALPQNAAATRRSPCRYPARRRC